MDALLTAGIGTLLGFILGGGTLFFFKRNELRQTRIEQRSLLLPKHEEIFLYSFSTAQFFLHHTKSDVKSNESLQNIYDLLAEQNEERIRFTGQIRMYAPTVSVYYNDYIVSCDKYMDEIKGNSDKKPEDSEINRWAREVCASCFQVSTMIEARIHEILGIRSS